MITKAHIEAQNRMDEECRQLRFAETDSERDAINGCIRYWRNRLDGIEAVEKNLIKHLSNLRRNTNEHF